MVVHFHSMTYFMVGMALVTKIIYHKNRDGFDVGLLPGKESPSVRPSRVTGSVLIAGEGLANSQTFLVTWYTTKHEMNYIK